MYISLRAIPFSIPTRVGLAASVSNLYFSTSVPLGMTINTDPQINTAIRSMLTTIALDFRTIAQSGELSEKSKRSLEVMINRLSLQINNAINAEQRTGAATATDAKHLVQKETLQAIIGLHLPHVGFVYARGRQRLVFKPGITSQEIDKIKKALSTDPRISTTDRKIIETTLNEIKTKSDPAEIINKLFSAKTIANIRAMLSIINSLLNNSTSMEVFSDAA